MAKENKSKTTVLLAVGANAAVALAKIVAGLLGGSAIMMAETGTLWPISSTRR
jgi:divalent metal cation (Fe/Co/Zn/Cd) transporter